MQRPTLSAHLGVGALSTETFIWGSSGNGQLHKESGAVWSWSRGEIAIVRHTSIWCDVYSKVHAKFECLWVNRVMEYYSVWLEGAHWGEQAVPVKFGNGARRGQKQPLCKQREVGRLWTQEQGLGSKKAN